MPDEAYSFRESVRTEENERKQSYSHCIAVTQYFRHFLGIYQLVGFKHHESAVEKSPDDEIETCAVPQTCAEEYRQFVESCADFSLAVSAEWDVEVLLEPC
jgi:hypothetical protein